MPAKNTELSKFAESLLTTNPYEQDHWTEPTEPFAVLTLTDRAQKHLLVFEPTTALGQWVRHTFRWRTDHWHLVGSVPVTRLAYTGGSHR